MESVNQSWKKIAALLILTVTLLMDSRTAEASQMSTYTTFTFNTDGIAVESPEAYRFVNEYDGESLEIGSFNNPTDLFVDKQQNVYVVDNGNNRIVILNADFSLKEVLSTFSFLSSGVRYNDSLAGPSAVYVTEDGQLYIADTDNNRVVQFDEDLNYVRQLGCPKSKILGDEYVFSPTSIAVDSSNRIYLLIKDENQGIVELTADGSFIGYYGAQQVQQNVFDWFKTLFMTKEQKSRVAKIIPRTYNSMTIDDKDFVWLTSNSLTVYQRKNYMTSKSSANAPIKRLNPSGSDVLKRQGKYAPGGDLLEVSSLVDVTVKENGVYSVLDNLRNRIFTYDEGGNLLYAFGGSGAKNGCMTLAKAIAYKGDDLLTLDNGDGVIVHYGMTEYASNIQKALAADEEKDFDGSIACWGEVLKENQNLELAYKAMGNSFLRNNDYKKAMEYYRNAGETEGYSKAYQYVRTAYVKKNFMLVVGIFLSVLVLWLLLKRWVNKENRRIYAVGTRQTLKSELLYAFRVIYHPFDGFWEIKMQKRGTMRSATLLLAAVVLTFCYKEVGTGWLFRAVDIEDVNLLITVLTVLIPLVLWCSASWGLTTLFGGKGKMKDIYIMTCYSMFPLIFANIVTTIMSKGMVLEEQDFMAFVTTVGFAWMAGLIFAGSLTIHEYQFNKNLLMIVASIVGMGVMMFLALLFVTVGQKMIEFFITVYEEIVYRL